MNYREVLIRLMSMTTPFVYDSEESFLEMLRKFYQYLHELTKASKEMSNDIEKLREEQASFEDEINQQIIEINELLIQYNMKIDIIKNELYVYVDDKIINLKNYVDSQYAYLQEEIEQIENGNITVYDPTTGLNSPLQIVINNLYDMGRSNSLTAYEYDTLELTATDFDAYEITAKEYDINGKEILG